MKNLLLLIIACIFATLTIITTSIAETITVTSTKSEQTVWSAPSAGTYQITASGLWLNGGWLKTDAAGYANRENVGWVTEHEFAGVAEGECCLLINNTFVDWGSLNKDHTYTIRCKMNKGDKLGFSIADTYPIVDSRHGQVMNWYFDNVGQLTVNVTPVQGHLSAPSLSGFCSLK